VGLCTSLVRTLEEGAISEGREPGSGVPSIPAPPRFGFRTQLPFRGLYDEIQVTMSPRSPGRQLYTW
jgi:hypothetical protein